VLEKLAASILRVFNCLKLETENDETVDGVDIVQGGAARTFGGE
jgi:hypothetical protein